MFIGVNIEKGPNEWQILQQQNGYAIIELSGTFTLSVKDGKGRVFARILSEETGDTVISWTECNTKDNIWDITFYNVPKGGLYRIETCLNQSEEPIEWSLRGDMIHHIGVGDLYVISGQSNSAGYGKDPIYDPPEIGVHIFKNSGKWDIASHPLNDSTNTVHEENREGANPGHSPYLAFAKKLKRELGYPIGLIQASLGGSPLSAWNPDEDGVLYRCMIKIIESDVKKIKGILWYQGCSDTNGNAADTYFERFSHMVNHMRKDLGNNDLSIITVQLNRCLGPTSELGDRNWGKVREAQRQAARKLHNVFVVPSIDCPLSDLIHNSSSANIMLGERMARMALSKIYGKKYLCDAPDLKSAEAIGTNNVLLTFDNIYERLYALDMTVQDLPFEIEDESGKINIKGYEIKNINEILLTLSRDLNGKCFVSGAYEQNPKVFVPIDVVSHIPMLSFYRVEIKDK